MTKATTYTSSQGSTLSPGFCSLTNWKPSPKPRAIPDSHARKYVLCDVPRWQWSLSLIKNRMKREPISPVPNPVSTGTIYITSSLLLVSINNNDAIISNSPVTISLCSSAFIKTNFSANRARRKPNISHAKKWAQVKNTDIIMPSTMVTSSNWKNNAHAPGNKNLSSENLCRLSSGVLKGNFTNDISTKAKATRPADTHIETFMSANLKSIKAKRGPNDKEKR